MQQRALTGLFVMGLMVAGCAPQQAAAPEAATPASAAKAPAPAAPAAAAAAAPRVVGASDAGRTITLTPGQKLQIEVIGVPTAGYLWRVGQIDAGWQVVESTSRPENPAGRAAGMVGGQDWSVFVLDAPGPSPRSVTLVYGRPWELDAGSPPTETLTFTAVSAVD